ncbi:MAG: AMP-binding protein [Rhodococcus sp. (in: high G+C Gram-positive bacteria)]
MNRLTAAQSAMLFDQIADPADVGHNVVASVIVASTAPAQMHEAAWLHALRRHPLLRTRIVAHDNGFRFESVEGAISVDVAEVPDVRNRRVREDLALGAVQPFDLFGGPLVRASVRCDGHRAVVSLVVHHILVDVASAPLILNEFFAHLRSLEFGEPGTSIAPGADFDVFVDDEQSYLVSADADTDRAYWRAVVGGYSNDPLATLPTSNNAPADPLEPFVRLEAEPEATEMVRAHAKSLSVSPAAVFLAAFQRALAMTATSAPTDIAVGMPVLQRDARHLTTLGSFTQLAVARSCVGQSLDDDIRAAGAAIAGARRHGRMPLSEYARYADEPTNLTRTSFLYEPSHLAFGTAFVLGDRWEFDLSGYQAQPYPIPSQTGQFDLRFQVGLVHGRYVCAVHFGPRHHHAAVLVAEHIRDELRRIAPGASIDIVVPGEFGSGWTHPADREPSLPLDVIARIGEIARTHPDRVAVSTGGVGLDYAALWHSASRVARRLSDRRGELVAVMMPKQPDAVAVIIGIMLSGNAFVVIDPAYPEQRRALMLDGIGALVVASTAKDEIPSAFAGTVFEHDPADERSLPIALPVPDRTPPTQSAYAVYTSGSTGRPKRVLVGRAALAQSNSARDVVYEQGPQRFLHLSSLSFDSAYAGLFWTLAQGGELLLVDMSEPHSTAELADTVANRGVTHLLAIPSLYEALLDESACLASLRQVIVAGEECTEALVDRHHSVLPGVTLTNEYGPSESAIWSTADHIAAGEPVTIGRAVPGIGTRVVDESGRSVVAGTAGELHLSGTLAYGYDGDPRATADKFRPDPWATDGQRLYATGDRVRIGSNGRLLFDGRVDEQFKISGFRVEPREVEAVVRRITGHQCVAGVARGPGGRRDLVIAVDEATFAELDVDTTLSRIRDEVPAHLAPRAVSVVEAIPRNVNGKVDRRAVAALLSDVAVPKATNAAPTGNDTDSDTDPDGILVDAVRHALSRDVDARRTFVEHGGDSIAALRVVGFLHRRGFRLSPRELLAPVPLCEVWPVVAHEYAPKEDRTHERADILHTNRSQRAMLLQTAQGSSSGVYVEQLVLELSGEIDIDRLVAAWRSVFSAFPILGAHAPAAPYSTLDTGRSGAVPIEVHNEHVDWARVVSEDRERGFTLTVDALSRVQIVRGVGGVRVLWTHHHGVADGWSLPVILSALAAAYRSGEIPNRQAHFGYRTDETVVAPPSNAHSLVERLPAPTNLEFGAQRTHIITPPDDLASIADRLGITVAAVVNTVWALALGSTFGTRTVEHGMVGSGRDIGIPGMDSAVGMFVRIDPITATWSDVTTLAELGAGVADRVAAAMDGPVVTGWTPETLVVVENYPLDPSALSFGPDVDTTSVDLLEQTEFAMVLQYRQWPDSVFHLHVDTEVVSPAAATALASRVHALLAALSAAPADSTVCSIVPAPVLETVDSVVEQPVSIIDAFVGNVREQPDRVALVDGSLRTTYAELDGHRRKAAETLHATGVAPGNVVAVRAPASIALTATLLAIATVGATWIVIDDDLPDQRVDAMLSRSGAHWSLVPGAQPTRSTVPVAASEATSADHLAYLIFTSGTTGDPKVIAVEHNALARHLSGTCARFDYRRSDVVLVFGSVAFDASLEQLMGALYVGATAVGRPRDIVEPSALAAFLGEHDVTVFNPPTGYWTQCASASLPSTVRTVIVGGEALPAWATRVPEGVTLWNAYGPTEAVVTALAHRVDGRAVDPLPIGTPQPGRGVAVLGPDLLPVSDGVIGEIWLSGVLAAGYRGDPRSTAEAFRPQVTPHASAGDRMYRTGDLGYTAPDGSIVFIGRVDRQAKVRGYRVDPGEIETAAVSVDGVFSARALLVAPSDAVAVRIECVVVTRDVDAQTVRAAMGRSLPAHLVPARVHVVRELPLTRNGKVDDAALRTQILANTAAVGDPGDAADIEGIVTSAVREVLGVVRPDVGFVSAGGDSLRALELSAIVRRSGIVLDVQVALADGTVGALVATASVDPSAMADGTQPTRSRLLPPAVHWFDDRVSGAPISPWNMAIRLDLDVLPDTAAVDSAVAEVLRVHPMLRARLDEAQTGREFVLAETCPVVFFFDTVEFEVEQACKRVFNMLTGRVGIDNGTPIGFGIVRAMDSGTATVVVLAHHLVMDVVSLHIVAGDFIDALSQCEGDRCERDVRLPPEYTSVHEWVQWLASDAGAPGIYERCRAAYRGLSATVADLGCIDPGTEGDAVAVRRHVSTAVIDAATAAVGASVEEILQSAAATAYFDGTGASPVVIEIETHGRELGADGIDLTRTVGWFTGLSAVPVHPGTPGEQIAEIRGRRVFLGASGHRPTVLRYVLGTDPGPGVRPHLGVNYVGRLDEDRQGSARAYGDGHLRAAHAARPVAVQIDAWFRGDELVIAVEHVNLASASVLADAMVAALTAASAADPIAVEAGLCAIDLRGNSVDDVLAAGPVEALAPLTEVQEAMYLRSGSDADAAYVEQLVLKLPDGVDLDRLCAAVLSAAVVMPLLRADIVWEGLADPVLVVRADAEPVSVRGTLDARSEVDALARGSALFRAIIACGTLALTFHHLVADGWTVRILLQHIDDHYFGRPVPKVPDRRMLEHMVVSANRERLPALDRSSAALLPPVDRATPATGSGNIDLTRSIEAGAARELRRAAARRGVTLASVAHAGWALLLGGSGRHVRFGSVGQYRPAGHDDSPGMYIETRTVDVRLPDDVDDLLTSMHSALQRYPDTVVHEVDPEATVTAGGGAMYETAVIVDDARGTAAAADFLGHPVEVLDTRERTGLAVTASVIDHGGASGVEVTLNCDLGQVTEQDGHRMLGDYVAILAALAEPATSVSELASDRPISVTAQSAPRSTR